MSRGNLQLTGKRLIFIALAIFSLKPGIAQTALSIPSWLENYPGVTAMTQTGDLYARSSFTAAAKPGEILEHYRKVFEAAGVPFQPNSDGIGTSIRAAAPECDLLIQIRTRPQGTFVDVNCSAKSASSSAATPSAAPPPDLKVTTSRPASSRINATRAASSGSTSGTQPQSAGQPQSNADWMAEHHRKAAEMGLHREYHDMPAPPLEWPSWLTHVNGAEVRSQAGMTPAKDATLTAHYTTHVPMTDLRDFYRALLDEHEYPGSASMSTGHTMTGVQQNAIGYVEGFNYPDGAPGAYSVIDVSFDRSVLNGPITVTLKLTTHEYIAKRGY